MTTEVNEDWYDDESPWDPDDPRSTWFHAEAVNDSENPVSLLVDVGV